MAKINTTDTRLIKGREYGKCITKYMKILNVPKFNLFPCAIMEAFVSGTIDVYTYEMLYKANEKYRELNNIKKLNPIRFTVYPFSMLHDIMRFVIPKEKISYYAILENKRELDRLITFMLNAYITKSFRHRSENPERDIEIVKENIMNKKTYASIGKMFDLSGNWVSQINNKFIRMFRHFIMRDDNVLFRKYVEILCTKKIPEDKGFFFKTILPKYGAFEEMPDYPIIYGKMEIYMNNMFITQERIRYFEEGSKIVERPEGETMHFSFGYDYYDLYE